MLAASQVVNEMRQDVSLPVGLLRLRLSAIASARRPIARTLALLLFTYIPPKLLQHCNDLCE